MSDSYKLDVVDLLQQLGTDAVRGLNQTEAARRLAEHGPNELVERGAKSRWLILWGQLASVMVVTLIIAAFISALAGDFKDAVSILAIVVLNAVLGFTQESRAERAMAALKKLAVPTVKVRRDGRVQEVSARELVPGDIVMMEAGNLVPADCRLLKVANLRIQEAALTGESEPVEKDSKTLPADDLPLGDRRNLAYMGTVVTYGRGLGVVTETGMETELGAIATMIQMVAQEPTPLQQRLAQLGRGLALAALVIVGIVFVLGLLRGEDIQLMFLTAVSMAVAAVPEGLPAVVTIVLAMGAQRMLKRQALIRKLPSVETLGSVTVICSDKTGTLTENRMTVTVFDVAGHRINLDEYLRQSLPMLDFGEQLHAQQPQPALALLMIGGALCNDTIVRANGEGQGTVTELSSPHTIGDPTENALVVAATRFGLWKAELEDLFPRVAEVPFDSERKLMTTIHQVLTSNSLIPSSLEPVWNGSVGLGNWPYVAFTKGAVDRLLEVSSEAWIGGRAEPLNQERRERIAAANDHLAQSGMRVLGVAFRPLESVPGDELRETIERDLIFVGMAGMIDPARPEAKDAVSICQAAGIRPVMITGDHPLTARHIARELSIAAEGRILTGQDLDRLSVEELEDLVEEVPLYARVSPEHKLKIVEALQNRGHIVAMTGDGVNDAPALKKADIGVAMGVTGTDVSKEAADMVLLDDHFDTIVAAVEEGRIIYDNIRKFIKYIATSNSAEIWVMVLAPFLGMPLPLLPLQILWMNLATDGLPAVALGVELAERDIMHRPPYRPDESIFGQGVGRHIIWVGLLMALVSLGTGYWYWQIGDGNWQTMLFTILIFSQLGHVLAVRSSRDSFFSIGPWSNMPLLVAVVLTFTLQLMVVYVPFLQKLFKTSGLPIKDLALSLALSTVVFWGVELEKRLIRLKP